MNTTKEYLDAMNQLDKKLEAEDRKYFTDLRAYMTTASFFKNEQAINEQLYQMYLDFLNAKNEGFTAEEFFGNDPKEMADQLLEQLPRASFKNLLEYIGIAAVVLWGIRLVSDFSQSVEVVINPALYIFDLVLVLTLITLLFKFIQRSVYKKTTRKMNFIEAIGAGLIFIFYIFIYLKADQFIPEILVFSIPYPWDLFIILGITLTALYLTLRTKETAFYGIALWIAIFSLIGIDMRLTMYMNYEIPFIVKIIILVLLGIAAFALKRRFDKKDK